VIKAIVFDLGNVLISFDHAIAARRIAKLSHKSLEEIYRLFFDSDLTQHFEEGKLSSQDFFLQVKEMLGLSIEYEEFLPIWNEIFFLTDENHQVYGIAKGLTATHTTALLSNINELHFNYLKARFPVFDVFHHLFASYALGAIKPNPSIYKKALETLKVKPDEAFYVDDRAELIEKASLLGMRAFLYRGPAQLIKDLSSCGIDIKMK
jgi:FMN phosphatase YigB (HAD superfamily)